MTINLPRLHGWRRPATLSAVALAALLSACGPTGLELPPAAAPPAGPTAAASQPDAANKEPAARRPRQKYRSVRGV